MFPTALIPIVAGLIGTALMLLFLRVTAGVGGPAATLPLAFGLLQRERRDGNYGIGLCLHLVMGIAFAWGYAAIVRSLDVHGAAIAGLTAALGTVHGLVVSMLMLATAEQHPQGEFRANPIRPALWHAVAHIVYGLGVGIVLIVLSPR